MLLAGHLAIVADGVGLVRLVKGLEPEEVDAPVEQATDGRLPVCLHVAVARLCGTGVATSCAGPASLCGIASVLLLLLLVSSVDALLTAVHEMDLVQAASHRLHVAQRLCHVVKVRLGRVGDVLVLPVGEAVSQTTHIVSHRVRADRSTEFSYIRSRPLVMIESMVPFAQQFQLSAVPILTLG